MLSIYKRESGCLCLAFNTLIIMKYFFSRKVQKKKQLISILVKIDLMKSKIEMTNCDISISHSDQRMGLYKIRVIQLTLRRQ